MIKIKQLQQKLDKLIAAYPAVNEIPDPLYVAWIIDTIFDGGVPPAELQAKFPVIIEARRSRSFRAFWNAYKDANAAISGFQIVGMGVVAESTRKKYHEKFIKEHPEEVPF